LVDLHRVVVGIHRAPFSLPRLVGLTFAVQSIEGMYHADFAQRDFLFHVFPRQ
jgi:hypothetical protein